MKNMILNIIEAFVLAITSITFVAWFFGIDIGSYWNIRLSVGLVILGVLYYAIISIYAELQELKKKSVKANQVLYEK